MAKIVESKSSGKRYVQLENSELTAEEQRLVEASAAADKIAQAAAKALRDCVLSRAEFSGKAFNQVYRTYGGAVKIGIGEQQPERAPKAQSKSLADMLAEYDASGLNA